VNNSETFRLESGGRIDRTRRVEFTFNGRRYFGHPGDTLASALLANGVRVVSRSFKFHRPRGILSAGVEEPNALLGVDCGSGMVPIVRATMMPLVDGLRAETQHCTPSVNFDLGRILDYTRNFWPAGFYNKTFKWPSWKAYEWMVRRASGIGELPDGPDPTRYRHANLYCNVLVVGAGASGLHAAIEAAETGEDVVLVEQDNELGGKLLYGVSTGSERSADEILASLLSQIRSLPNVRVMLNSSVAGYYDNNVLTIHERSNVFGTNDFAETYWKVRARKVVLATGAIEQPILFAKNDLPGVMLTTAIRKYAVRYGVRCGDRVVAIVNNDHAYRDVFAIADAGIQLKLVIDMRSTVSPSYRQSAEEKGIRVYVGAMPVEARGSRCVRSIRFNNANDDIQEIQCDTIAMSGGLSPTVHLFSQSGGKLRYSNSQACFVPGSSRQDVEVVGSANGDFGTTGTSNIAMRRAAPANTQQQFVDLHHDVTVSDIELSVCENFVSVEHMKRFTTAGTAVDQGKTSNLNALSLLGQLTNREPSAVGTTTFRPQFMPVTLGAIAGCRRGKFYSPARLLPAHQWHEAHGAIFDDYGGWKRPAYYGTGERSKSIAAEARQVRAAVGLFDGSPLGKIEVKGPDAADFLSRLYVNTVHTLQAGKIRYGIMLNENGTVIDDGVFVRLAEDHFLLNTTSANSDRMLAWFEEWRQCEWPDLRVVTSGLTSQWAVATVAGPRSRETLSKLPGMIDLGTEVFPHMSFAQGILADGTPYRIQRVSYTGELSYELSVPASTGAAYFERIWEEGASEDIALFGVEALDMLRAEKGFVHVGADTDITTNPFDIGFRKIVENKKSDFIGRRSLKRENDAREGRRQFVGVEFALENASVRTGAHFVRGEGSDRRSEGFVTTACFSPALNKTIGLGLIERGFSREGETVNVYCDGKIVSARIVSPRFFDPTGGRMRA
jgi:sarcosine oxidase, subunit alpha